MRLWIVSFFDSHTSSEYSDWTADAGINLQPSTPLSSRKRAQRRISSSEEEEEEENEEEEEKQQQQQQQSDEEERAGKKSKGKSKKAKSKTPRVSFDSVSRLMLMCHWPNPYWLKWPYIGVPS